MRAFVCDWLVGYLCNLRLWVLDDVSLIEHTVVEPQRPEVVGLTSQSLVAGANKWMRVSTALECQCIHWTRTDERYACVTAR